MSGIYDMQGKCHVSATWKASLFGARGPGSKPTTLLLNREIFGPGALNLHRSEPKLVVFDDRAWINACFWSHSGPVADRPQRPAEGEVGQRLGPGCYAFGVHGVEPGLAALTTSSIEAPLQSGVGLPLTLGGAVLPMSTPMINIDVASSARHFEQILDLQRRYHASALSRDAQEREGFVFVEHSVPLLQRMSAELPQAIALAGDDAVVGYCLSLSLALRSEVPSLAPMFDQFSRCTYRGKPLSSLGFFVGGQVCVHRAYRGRGLLARLYEQVRLSAPPAYELCVTEIAVRNQVSVRAHQRMGFEPVSTYSDGSEAWVIVAWDLGRPAVFP